MSIFVAFLCVVPGYALGRAAGIRRSAQLLRDACHFDAANLIDSGRNEDEHPRP